MGTVLYYKYRLSLTIILTISLFLFHNRSHAAEAAEQAVQTVVQADIAGQLNPDGAMLSLGGYRRWINGFDKDLGVPSSYLQAGIGIGSTPAFGRASLYAEWLAVVFAKVRVQYDRYRFYGMNSSLLSFPTATSVFSQDDIDAMKGKEEAANGSRFLVRPTLYAKAGAVLMVNQTDLAYFRFSGTGPYFLEWSYETLLKDRDRIFENRTNFLVELRKGTGTNSLLAGPYYEIMKTAAADLTRQRAGIMAYWVPREAVGMFREPRFFAQLGYYLEDRNLEGEYMATAGMGFNLEL